MRSVYIKTSRFPKAREGHTCVCHKDCLYLYGGCEGGGDEPVVYFADLNSFDLRGKKWNNVRPSGEIPSGRDGHSCGVLDERMLIYGGNTADGLSDEVFTFLFSKNTWTKHRTVGWNPGKRESSGSCVIRDTMYLFGGNVNEDPERDDICASDLFTFRFVRGEVYCEQIRSLGATPPPRVSHTLTAVDDHCFLLVGGEKDGFHLNDVWIYYLDYSCWSQVQSHMPLSSKMAHTAACYRGKVIIFGGMDRDSVPRSELITIALHNHPFAQMTQKTNGGEIAAKCGKCGHKPLECGMLEEFEGFKYPVFNCYSRVLTCSEAIREAADHRNDPYIALLSILRFLGGSIVKLDLLSSEAPSGTHSPSESSSDSSASTLAEGSAGKVLQIHTCNVVESEALWKLGNSDLLASIAAVGTGVIGVSKNDDFLSVTAVKLTEDSAECYFLIYDKEGNCMYPDSAAYLKTLDIIVKLSGMQLARLSNHAQGTTVYIHTKMFTKRMGMVSSPGLHPSFSVADFLQYVYHNPPAMQQFIVANTLVLPRYAPEAGLELKWERSPHFARCRFSGPGPSSIRVYRNNVLAYLWLEETNSVKRPRSEANEHLILELFTDDYLYPDRVPSMQTLNIQLARELLALDTDC